MSKLKIPQKVVDELNRQFNQELSAAHSYLALSVWCDVRNLKGFGKYFVKQAGEEHLRGTVLGRDRRLVNGIHA